VAENHAKGLLDTCVVIDIDLIPAGQLPLASAVSAITLAELAAGPATAKDPGDRAVRMLRLQTVEASCEPLAFDEEAARMYGLVAALVIATGRNPRPRKPDLMIAATAAARKLPLYTRNADDFKGLESLLTVIAV
jgi:predicted nucleic acid-binding protein